MKNKIFLFATLIATVTLAGCCKKNSCEKVESCSPCQTRTCATCPGITQAPVMEEPRVDEDEDMDIDVEDVEEDMEK